jgi:hypothetical protein
MALIKSAKTQIYGLTTDLAALQAADAAEATTRAAAVTTLTTNLAAEATTRAAADTTLTTNLAAEVTARAAAITATIAGNVASATVLHTARTINGISFNGSANITINAVDSTARIASSLIGAANGVVPLDATSKILATYLPSYVDDVLEATNLAAFPVTGEIGKIYVALDTNKTYRWSGSVYVYITSGAVDSVAGKTGIVSLVKADVGLANVDNTSDANKPLSTAGIGALALKANLASPTFTGTVSGITKAMVGLGNVDNTTDAAKPISTLTQAALTSLDTTLKAYADNSATQGGSLPKLEQLIVTANKIVLTKAPKAGLNGIMNFGTVRYVDSNGIAYDAPVLADATDVSGKTFIVSVDTSGQWDTFSVAVQYMYVNV